MIRALGFKAGGLGSSVVHHCWVTPAAGRDLAHAVSQVTHRPSSWDFQGNHLIFPVPSPAWACLRLGSQQWGGGPYPAAGTLLSSRATLYSATGCSCLLLYGGLLSVWGQTTVFVPHSFQDRYLMLSKVPPLKSPFSWFKKNQETGEHLFPFLMNDGRNPIVPQQSYPKRFSGP